MVDQTEDRADELGGDYVLTMLCKRTVVARELADVRHVLNLRPSGFKRGPSAVGYHLLYCIISALKNICISSFLH